uniref:ribosomal protein S1 n=1 Tax=Madagascaria erythrocladioides TaxID=753684 RepID=UPI001BF15F11|nr:ribosomal protein S1 [Madagascaria erythrocladioides]QUE28971.1 ribosomal protein S1 [Madagascaria erythrocladioides]UNJ16522.1 ribosomal protein S1 [Madagascaria erythrocladioides]
MLNSFFLSSQKKIQTNLKNVLENYKHSLNKGEIVAGAIFSCETYGFLINIGAQSAAFLPKQEVLVNTNNKDLLNSLSETREFLIIEQTKKGKIILSVKQLNYIKAWERIKQLYKEDIVIYSEIIKKNNGGLLVDIEGLVGFVPNSHSNSTEMFNSISVTKNIIPVKFLEINENLNYVVLSCKRFVLQTYSNKFNVGKVINGTIKDIKKYGVFVDIGETTGLLHISEITNNNNVGNLKQIFKIGDKIWVSIIHIDTKQARISLSTKFLD